MAVRAPRRHRAPSPRSTIGVVLAGVVLAAACSSGSSGDDASGAGQTSSTTTEPAVEYPGAAWATVGPAEAGFDATALDALAGDAEAAGSTCLLVTRDGEVVDERTWKLGADEPREAFSVTKSVTSTLVGIAQDRGLLDIADQAAEYIPAWAGTDAEAVTVEDLLANDSGRQWSLAIDYQQLIRAPDRTAFAIGLGQEHEPGTVWAYNNSAIQTLGAVLADATGEEAADFAEEALFGPLDMDHSSMTRDSAGGTTTFMGLQTTCRDLARFGYLMLQHGRWDGEQVVSTDWVEAATGRSSQDLNAAYGYLWWLNRKGPLGSPTVATNADAAGSKPDGQMVPDAPEDVFWALGLGNQIVAVVPSEGIVAVRMGAPPPADAPFGPGELTTGVLGAIDH